MSKRFKVKLLIGVFVFFIVIIGLYLAVAFYYNSRFMPGTTINEMDFAGSTVEDAEEIISDEILDYSLAVYDKDNQKEFIMGTEIGLDYTPSGELETILEEQNNFLWLFQLSKERTYTLKADTTYDADKLTERMKELAIFQSDNIIEPVDATYEYVSGEYVIVKEIEGNKLDEEYVKELIKDAVDAGETELYLAEYDCYVKPAVTSDDPELNEFVTKQNEFLAFTITYEFGSRSETLTGETIKDWITYDDDGNMEVDYQSAYNYVEQLAMKYNTWGNNRTIDSAQGFQITVSGGDYGWAIDKDTETDNLIALIKAGESTPAEPTYFATGLSREEKDWLDTFVEVDITKQKVWFTYEGRVLLDGVDVVTGTVSKEWDTNTGTYPVMWKKTDTPLVGEGYTTPVKYFIPFYTNVGFHDASWRSSFGGEIYKTNGSHGCVNMKEEDVVIIYDYITAGIPVFVYTTD